ITAGVPVAGESVRVVEELGFGANGVEGAGSILLEQIEGLAGFQLFVPRPYAKVEGWAVPQTGWDVDLNDNGVYPSPGASLKISAPGIAHSDLVRVDPSQTYVVEYMVDVRQMEKGSVKICVDEYSMKGSRAFLIQRASTKESAAPGITSDTFIYTPSGKDVKAIAIAIEAQEADGRLEAYCDGIRVSRVVDSEALNWLRQPHVIFRFDDGWKSQFAAADILHRYGYPAVYNIIPETMWDERTGNPMHVDNEYMTLQNVQALAAQGNQIGAHSASENVTAETDRRMFDEIVGKGNTLRMLGFPASSYCSPECLYDQNTLRYIYRHFYSHQIKEDYDGINGRFPFDRYHFYMRVPASVNSTDYDRLAFDEQVVDRALWNNATITFMFHKLSTGPAQDSYEYQLDAFRKLVEHVHLYEGRLGVTTYD
ncbi:MAG TPA: polysaccharide deacetylase family protein, partial [Candidatus Omnitrophota bacterium]|nr:polysaccharide deacetylase family protein [Candidatus Omnitrophota bacterium]